MERIYLDYNATTPLDPRIAAAVAEVTARLPGNPSSIHSFGREARELVDRARELVAVTLRAKDPGEIVFTASGSEANGLAVLGVLRAWRERHPGSGPPHVVLSAIEHSSLLQAVGIAAAEVSWVPPDPDGRIDPGALRRAIRPGQTVLASVTSACNEVGTIQPVAALSATCHELGVTFHTDAVQALGKCVGWRVDEAAPDLITVAAHKVYGQPGAAALYCRSGVELAKLIPGGHQEDGRRGGTENVPAIVGFGMAAHLAEDEFTLRVGRMDETARRVETILARVDPAIVVNASTAARVPNTVSARFPAPCTGERLAVALDIEGIAVSTGSACAAGTTQPSHVLQAMGVDGVERTLRISTGKDTTSDELDAFTIAIGRVYERFA